MKKKLTKEQWFEAAWHWEQTDRDRSDGEFVWDARCEAHDSVEHVNNDRDRWFMYSQFCLEKAGISVPRKSKQASALPAPGRA